ncbi:MAG: glycoside hydrolase family 3 C-terminal domain-containing protein [Muribaculum sp.]|nr:glycoside hydrolase family 3 C-terminal domain-containing protein [Muribaculum sp.]
MTKSLFIKCFVALSSIVIVTPVFGQVLPYLDTSLSADERAKDLLSRLTLDEKISLMTNGSPAIERLGIPEYNWWNEALHGVGRSGTATVFPQAIAMAATFDDRAVYESFDMISDEARVKYNQSVRGNNRGQYRGLTYWTPNINIFRDPRWGRGQETYGEDPYLTSMMGMAVIRGLQGDGTEGYDKLHACAKHFAVHSGPEWNRHTYNASNIPPEDLWETYLPAFKAAVLDAGVKEVMCAYNRYDDEPCCSSSKLLKQILRGTWGYDDVVLSDCGALGDFFTPEPYGHGTHATPADAAADALLTGNDLECGNRAFPKLKESYEAGLVTEEDIDRSVLRLLRARFQLGNLYDDELTPWWSLPDTLVACTTHRRKALEMARKSVVLLTNKNGILPLDASRLSKIAVVGPNADDSLMMWGNYNGYPKSSVTVLQGLRDKFTGAEVVYTKGCDFVSQNVMLSDYDKMSVDGQTGMRGTFWNNPEMKGNPIRVKQFTTPLNLTNNGETAFAPDVPVLNFSARFEGVFQPDKSGPVSFSIEGDDGFKIIIDGETVVDSWHDGKKNEHNYVLEAEKGRKYDVVVEYYQKGGGAELKFDVGQHAAIDYEAVASGVSDADVIVFVGGLTPHLEGEEMGVYLPGFKGGDRTAIELPAVQENMLKALKATGRPVVFVLCTGSAVASPWAAENCDAIINLFYPGESGGTALADVISGDYNPAGRLPITYYASTADLPDFEDYFMDNRTYRFFNGRPLFPFGHGLSYTTFSYGDVVIDRNADAVLLKVPVSNTGQRAGDEVVQVYVKNLQNPSGPKKSLKAFRRVSLGRGETKVVDFELPRTAFECYDRDSEQMIVMPGEYEVYYGGTSADDHLKRIRLALK